MYTCRARCVGARVTTARLLEVHYRGKTIADVLDMPIEEGLEFFAAVPAIASTPSDAGRCGPGYVRLGQPAPTLSGGEAQRVKLSAELQKRSTDARFTCWTSRRRVCISRTSANS